MTDRQKKFAEYYAQKPNIVQSALKAGYSEKYANKLAHKLLENIGVAEYIEQLAKDTKRIAEEEKNKRIMDAKDRQVLLSDIAQDSDNALSDRIRAIDTLNKMTGEYVAKVQADVKTSQKFADILTQLGGEGLEE